MTTARTRVRTHTSGPATPARKPAEPTAVVTYVVEVNEGVVEASRQGIDWWRMFRRYEVTGRIRETKPACIVAGTVEVACESREHADWLARHMVDHGGLPRTAVRVKRPLATTSSTQENP